MATLDKFIGIRIGVSYSDKILDYAGTISFINGCIAIIFGIFSFGLGIAAICTGSSAGFIGYGIWCGFVFCVSGVIYMTTCKTRSACQITIVMTFALMSVFCSIIQFSLGVVGTYYDSRRESYRMDYSYGSYVFNIFNSRNVFGDYYCTGETNHTFFSAWAPVNILLLITGFIELIANLMVTILTFISLCCGTREVVNYEGVTNPAFSQVDLGGSYRPPMYKVFFDSA